MMALTLCNGIALWPTLHDGVVISASTPVRVAPVPMGDPLFVLPEAETVRISAVYEGFVLVQTRARSHRMGIERQCRARRFPESVAYTRV